jgi:hypothetical protein
MSWLTQGTDRGSFLSRVGRFASNVATAPAKAANQYVYKPIEKTIAKIPHTTMAEKRAQMEATTAQIGYYQEAKTQLQEQAKQNEAQKSMERARINEKQIRARRNAFRSKTSINDTVDTSSVKSQLG